MEYQLTDGARRVLDLACSAAAHDGVANVGATYVFLGLAHYQEAHQGERLVATAVLEALNVSLNSYAESFGDRKPEVPTPRAKPLPEFMTVAITESKLLPLLPDHPGVIGTEHLLLAIGRSDSLAAEYLRNAGVDYQQLWQSTTRLLGRDGSSGGLSGFTAPL